MTSHKPGNLIFQLRDAFESSSEVKWTLLKTAHAEILNGETSEERSDEYSTILTLLLDRAHPVLFKAKWQEKLYDDFFLKGIAHEAFLVLMRRLTESSPSNQQTKILDLLEKFLHHDLMYSVLCSQCTSGNTQSLKAMSSSGLWNELLTFLVSLPERVANKTTTKMKKVFSSACYVPLLMSSIWKSLSCVHEKLRDGQDCTIEFLGRLVGRLCTAGHADVTVRCLYHQFVRVCETDFVWQRISQNLVTKIPPMSVEFFLANLLLVIEWYGCVEWFLGDTVLTDMKIQHLMTVKFLLIRQFTDKLVLQNIIGYLASSEKRQHLFHKVFSTLLDAWADESALRHQNFSHQLHLSSALMICASHLKGLMPHSKNRVLLQKVLDGVQIRIGNPELKVRSMGMAVGESLTSVLDPDAPRLEFDNDLQTTESQNLKELLNIPPKPENIGIGNEVYSVDLMNLQEDATKNSAGTAVADSDEEKADVPSDTLDSDDDDDDLKPYDMSKDEPPDAAAKPLYIRDCLQGLLEADKPEWTEKCLRAAESLIRTNPDELPEIAVEMCKVLLHLDDSFGMEDFVPCRHRAMIALAALCPVQVVAYLTSQFYERDYNIRQRVDILEVVAAASQEISTPKYKLYDSKPIGPTTSSSSVKPTEENWKQVIEKRLESKTRRISLGPRKPEPQPEVNIFGTVAGHFFFPLLEKFDEKSRVFNLLGDDSYVLGRLLYTLGIVMYSAANTVQARRMGSSLLKFIEAVRNHTETFVRQAAIFATSTVYMAVPGFHLLSDLQEDVISSQNWLNEVVERDFDTECQVRAAHTLQLLVKTIEDELPSLTEAIAESCV